MSYRRCLLAALVLLLPIHVTAQIAGTLDTNFVAQLARISGGVVNKVLVQPDGKILIAGRFGVVGGETRRGIARLEANGAVESTNAFDPGAGVSDEIFSMALQSDGKILIGGDFTRVNGTNRARIARLNADGSLDTTFDPGTGAVSSPSAVYALAVQPDDKILVAGRFNTMNGEARTNLVRLEPNGAVEVLATFNPGLGTTGSSSVGTIFALALQPDGKILIGGQFTNVNGQARSRIARLHADGSVEDIATFNPGSGADGTVRSLAVDADGKILVGGSFTNLNGEYRNALARLEPDGSVESTATFDPAGAQAGSSGGAMALQADGRIVLPSRRLLASGENETTATFDVGLGANGPVNGLALQADGRIFLIGSFTTVNGEPRHGLARLLNDPASASLTTSGNHHVRWTRSGSAPEISYATFELSINGGETWALIGAGTRATNGWELSGIELPANGLLRARGRTTGAESVGSAGLVENQLTIETTAPELRFSEFNVTPAPNGGTGRTIRATVEGGPAAAGLSLELQASSDLDVWTTIATATASTEGVASFEFVDNFEGEQRFYRVIRP